MKHPVTKILFLILIAVFLCLPISANIDIIENEASEPTGTFGDNLTWTLSEDGVLTVSGIGPMADQIEPGDLWRTMSHKDVHHVVIEDGVTRIGVFAFACFPSLESVTMADTVTSIGDRAFEACSLEEITLSKNLTSIGYSAFCNCVNLKSIILPDGITEIKTSTFTSCRSLTEVILPQNLKSIENTAFFYCRNIKAITFPAQLETIGTQAFSYCTALKNIRMHEENALREIEHHAFSECTGLISLNIQCDSLIIGDYAFSGCTNLGYVNLGYGVSEIGQKAFINCTRLKNVTLPGSLKSLSFCLFENCASLESIVIPKGIETVPSYAFRGCTALAQVTLSDTVTRIDNQAFEGCTSLRSILFGEHVLYLDYAIFNGCTALETVTVYHDSVSPWKTFHAGAPEDVVYRCHEGSSMHAFAIEHNLNYELLTDWDTVFSDISSDDAAYSAICHTADRGIFVGTSDDTFSPDMPLTRAMFVTLLGRMAGIDANAYTEQIFDDIPVDAWYAPYAAWAADEGIVIGVGDHHFGGDMLIDIQQAVTMLARYSGFPWDIVNSGQSAYDFPDSTEEMTYWSDSGIFWAVSIGLYEGKNGLLDLYTPLTRADTALLFSRFCQLILGA